MTLDDVSFTMKNAYISRATLDSDRHWTLLDLETGSIVWAPEHLRGYCGEQSSVYPPATRHRIALAKWEPSTHESSGSLSSSPRSIAHLRTANAAPTASPVFLARFSENAAEYDRSALTNVNTVGLTSPNPVGESGIYLLPSRGLRAPSSPIPAVVFGELEPLAENTVLGGLAPRTEHAALGGPPDTSTAFHDFRTHEPRIRIGGLSASPGRFVARVSASVVTTEGFTGRGLILPAADTVFVQVLTNPSRAARAPQKP